MKRFNLLLHVTLVAALCAWSYAASAQEAAVSPDGRTVAATDGLGRGLSLTQPLPGQSHGPANYTAPPPNSVLVYSNFAAPPKVYSAGGGWTESGANSNAGDWVQAMGFTPTHNRKLTQIDVAVGYAVGTPNSFTLQLRKNTLAGKPGALVNQWFVPGPLPKAGGCCGVQTVNIGPGTFVRANHRYWLVVLASQQSDAWLIWNSNLVSVFGPIAQSNDGGLTWTITYCRNGDGAFDVWGY
jgi:hypothetical protein